MRVAFIVSYFPSLSQTFVLNQITGVIDRGHQVDIYANFWEETFKIHPDVDAYQLLEHTSYFPDISGNYLFRLLKGTSLLRGNFQKNPPRIFDSLNFFKYGKKAVSLRSLYTAIPAIDKEPYDIIHCQFGTLSPIGLLFRKMIAPKAKLITSFRGYDISRHVQQLGEHIYDEIFRCGDFFLTNCEFFKRRLIKLGCDEQRIVVLGSGIDCSRFVFTPRHLVPGSKIKIVTTGRLVEKKGIEYGIRAIAKLTESYPNLEYTIIGDGLLREDLQKLSEELNISSVVKFLGWQQQQEIIQVLDDSHIFMAPSVTARDGNQDAPVNVLKEAMAMGLPVVSTLHGGIPELVQDGVSGFLAPERDADALAQKLSLLIERSHLWPEMGRAGRAYVETHYNLHQLNDQLVEIYQQLLKQNGQPYTQN